MPNHVKKLSLTTEEKDFLMQLLHQRTLETRKYLRSRILLLKDEGLSNEKIADKLDVNVSTVRLCIEKYECGGIENALEDIRGRGRKREISDSDITWIISKACQKPVDLGLVAEFWYPVSFTRYLNSVAVKEGHPRLEHVSEYAVRKILKNAKIQPFKVKYYCEKRDPNFDSKMLQGIRVSGTEELKRRIYLYFEEINKVPVPYHWTYKLDDIDIEKEDINKIVYEVVNRKAAKTYDQGKRAPEPIKRNRKSKEPASLKHADN